jgi:tRNA-Thr(GGU) m(6)t(6)A37 methyltransferase TsaA
MLNAFRKRRGETGSPAATPVAPVAAPDPDGMVLTPIGVVRNRVHRPRIDGWDKVESEIRVEDGYVDGLSGLGGFSHVIVLTWLHLAAAESREAPAIHPNGDTRLPRIGVFALRVAGRPNPIGLSVVELLEVGGGTLRVRGLDAIDGTAVIDVKPYLPPYDSVPNASLPDWARSE